MGDVVRNGGGGEGRRIPGRRRCGMRPVSDGIFAREIFGWVYCGVHFRTSQRLEGFYDRGGMAGRLDAAPLFHHIAAAEDECRALDDHHLLVAELAQLVHGHRKRNTTQRG